MCPFRKAEKRLNDCAEFWKQAEESYQVPIAFVRNTQATIQGLRSVTSVLQNAKRQIQGFDAWYAPWQEKMRQDRVLRWLVDTRNKIEKVGDIEPASKLHLTFCKGWLADKDDEIDVPASYTAERAADLFAKLIGPSSRAEDALIRFRREWRHPELPDSELLDALVYCYGFMQKVLLDGHRCLEDSIQKECPFYQAAIRTNEHLPLYMQDRSSSGSAWYRLKDRTITSFGLTSRPMDAKTASRVAKERYGQSFEGLHKREIKATLLERCEDLMRMGQHILRTDGGLVMFFFIEGEDFLMIGSRVYRKRGLPIRIRINLVFTPSIIRTEEKAFWSRG